MKQIAVILAGVLIGGAVGFWVGGHHRPGMMAVTESRAGAETTSGNGDQPKTIGRTQAGAKKTAASNEDKGSTADLATRIGALRDGDRLGIKDIYKKLG